MNIQEKTIWYKEILKAEYIYIFGAGKAANLTLERIENCLQKDIDGFIVSSLKENPTELFGYRVFELNDVNLHHEGLVILSTSVDSNESIEQLLRNAGFCNIIYGAQQMRFVEGNYSLPKLPEYSTQNHSPMIYIVTSHLNQHCATLDGGEHLYNGPYTYIQAGAALTDKRLCSVLDNTGDNISRENPYFCELTAGYWIAKNDNVHDWIGLNHYSRWLELNDDDIRTIVNSDVDVVLPRPLKFSQPIACSLHRNDIEILTQALPEKSNIIEFNKYLLDDTFYCGNIVFCKADIFKTYYEWMMEIIRKCEEYKKYNEMIVSKRLWGYYGEHLTNLYFRKNKFKILSVNLKNTF